MIVRQVRPTYNVLCAIFRFAAAQFGKLTSH